MSLVRLAVVVPLALAATLGCGTPPSRPPAGNTTSQQETDRSPAVSSREKLRELAHKGGGARRQRRLHPQVSAWHALAGVTELTVTAAGTYALDSKVTEGRRPLHLDGQLTPQQRDTVLALINQHDLLATPASTRNIGDDEEPNIIEVRDGDLVHELRVWHGDAMKLPGFHAFEQGLVDVIREVSGGAVLDTISC